MTRNSFPNKTGDYDIDGISIIILPDKIIVDTSGYRGGNRRASRQEQDDDDDEQTTTEQRKGKKGNKPSLVDTVMDNARHFLTHGIDDE